MNKTSRRTMQFYLLQCNNGFFKAKLTNIKKITSNELIHSEQYMHKYDT